MYLLALENRRNAIVRLNDRLEKLGHSAWVGAGSDSHASESKGPKNQKSESMKFVSSKFTVCYVIGVNSCVCVFLCVCVCCYV